MHIREHQPTHHTASRRKRPSRHTGCCSLDARNHYPQIKHHTPPPSEATTTTPSRMRQPPVPTKGRRGHTGLLSQSPIVCSMNFPPARTPEKAPPEKPAACCAPEPHPTTGHSPSNESLESPNPHTMRAGSSLVVLLRKEVIQPHLPVRLPCYDFVPIADPTFDGSLPYGLGHRLRVLPTFMT